MKNLLFGVAIIVVGIAAYAYFSGGQVISERNVEDMTATSTEEDEQSTEVSVTPISHATAVLTWPGLTVYTDPVGGAEAFAGQESPDVILITDIHGDHLSVETLERLVQEDTTIIAPQAVADMLPESLRVQTVILANGERTALRGVSVEAIPMYNLPESTESRHTKGRGNGYIVESEESRVYIAGDTADIPEMRALEGIDIAFIPMNLPYTMDVDTAADAVLDFAPRVVYPYHYRGQAGLSDVERFRQLVSEGNPDIDVRLLDWYPEEGVDSV